MGSYIGAQIFNKLGLFLLNKIKTLETFKNGEFGVFRDDGLAVIQSKSPRSAETTSKELRNIFDKWGF